MLLRECRLSVSLANSLFDAAGLSLQVVRKFELQLIRRTLQPAPGSLVVDHEQIAVRTEDVTQPAIDARKLRRRIQLHERRREQSARKVVADATAEEVRREVALRQPHAVVGV